MHRTRARAQRATNAPTVLLQARVDPGARAAVQAAAQHSGVSIAYYMETLILRLAEQPEGLPVIPPPARQQEALDISA
ncbi:hypothetical protein AB6N23_01825 [Cellulomonas sp. 179-A 9B4 NHS]|uniref:hypothetical protein n=1 Tax=Cellulomonas sp. 179-A 9B4 NHS TaxID=3142379 RepID=UPI0039A110E8